MAERDADTIIFNTEDAVAASMQPPKVDIPVFKLVSEDHPILKEVLPEFDFANPPVKPNDFASSLTETCKIHKGYGLSANQCGFKYRVFVMGTGDDYVAHFNPKVVKEYDSAHMVEGCLSFPFMGLHITRPAMVDVEYQDFDGNVKTATYSGITARCFQHELDHMNGIVYTSRAKPLALQQGLKKRKKLLHKIGLR